MRLEEKDGEEGAELFQQILNKHRCKQTVLFAQSGGGVFVVQSSVGRFHMKKRLMKYHKPA